MNSFIAINPTDQNDGTIINNGFFPDIDLNELRKAQNLDGTVTPARLRSCAVTAINSVNLDLATFEQQHKKDGFMQLKDVPASDIDNQSVLLHFYRQAVFSYTQALLIEKYINFDATSAAIKKADAVDFSASHFYREARYAVRDMLGISRSSFALI